MSSSAREVVSLVVGVVFMLATGCDAPVTAGTICRVDEDCPTGRYCAVDVCRFDCVVDRDCTGMGGVCDVRGRCGGAADAGAHTDATVGCTTDADGDGARSSACGGTDCDDSDPGRYPGNIEVCDPENVDEDCDPSTVGQRDADGDMWISSACCNGTTCGLDCDDSRPGVHSDAPEVCNDIDDDCDMAIDEGNTTYLDCDGDGFGRTDATRSGCPGPVEASTLCPTPVPSSTWTLVPGDCDDSLSGVHPGATEVCDGIDTNCDGLTPDTDADLDGHFVPLSCTESPGYGPADDCDDRRHDVFPGASPFQPIAYSYCPVGTHLCTGMSMYDVSCCDRDWTAQPCISHGIDLCVPDTNAGCGIPAGHDVAGEWACGLSHVTGEDYGTCPVSASRSFDFDCNGVEEPEPASSDYCATVVGGRSPWMLPDGSYTCGAARLLYSGTPACGSPVTLVPCEPGVGIIGGLPGPCTDGAQQTVPLPCR